MGRYPPGEKEEHGGGVVVVVIVLLLLFSPLVLSVVAVAPRRPLDSGNGDRRTLAAEISNPAASWHHAAVAAMMNTGVPDSAGCSPSYEGYTAEPCSVST